MNRTKKGIALRLTAAGVAIHNALGDARVGELLAAFGYDVTKLQEGEGILGKAEGAVEAQVAARGAWQTATVDLAAAEGKSRRAFQALSQVIRAAFGIGHPVLASLGLNRPMPERQSLFLTMATTLFDNVLADANLVATVARFGYTAKKLQDEKGAILFMAKTLHARESAKGAAQQATMDQSTAMGELDGWMSAFRRVARVALRGQEQLLEMLGILARNAKTTAQRQAPAKAAQTRKSRRDLLKVVTQKEVTEQAVA